MLRATITLCLVAAAGCTMPVPLPADAPADAMGASDTPGPMDAAADAPGCIEGGCDDGVFCKGVEQCVGGECVAGAPVLCNDGVACTDDRCRDAGCEFVPMDTLCTAAAGGRCDATGCQYPSCGPATCVADACFDAVCEASTCRRTSACADTETCCAGACMDCDDGNPCTTDMCGATGCVHIHIAAACDDGDLCTVGDRCMAGVCQGTPRCDDGNPCTTDTCNRLSASCSFAPTPAGPACGTVDPVTCFAPRCDGAGNCRSMPSGCVSPTVCCSGSCGPGPCPGV